MKGLSFEKLIAGFTTKIFQPVHNNLVSATSYSIHYPGSGANLTILSEGLSKLNYRLCKHGANMQMQDEVEVIDLFQNY